MTVITCEFFMENVQKFKKFSYRIQGMHCASCEILIERKILKVPGIQKVNVNHATGKAEILCDFEPQVYQLQNAIKQEGYNVSLWDGVALKAENHTKNTKRDYFEIGAIFLILAGLYLLLRTFNFFPKSLGISENMSYGFVFLLGLVAAMSTCLAVTGGLLLAVAAKHNEQNPGLSGFQKFKPNFYFNAGRIASYTILGGSIGALGSIFTFSARANGIITILASIVMIILGFQVLKLFPHLKRFQPKMPKVFIHTIHQFTQRHHKSAPLLLGASTFFLPCGFTQALQFYILSNGDFFSGAFMMFFFSLGTLPALLSLGAISSFSKGWIQRYFLKFSGALVIVLGFFNINNGLTLTGSNINFTKIFPAQGETRVPPPIVDPNVKLVDGKQIVPMKVNYIDYTPLQFTVFKDIPVEWQIDGRNAAGCTQIITIPTLGITEYLPKDRIKTITFTPKQVGEIRFSCSMGMTDPRAKFIVVESNNAGFQGAEPSNSDNDFSQCNPEFADCMTLQKVQMEVSRAKGFYPNILTVKRGYPVELEIDTKDTPRGCMSVMVIPEYNIAHRLAMGKSAVSFIPQKAGNFPLTCSMGARMGEIRVINKI